MKRYQSIAKSFMKPLNLPAWSVRLRQVSSVVLISLLMLSGCEEGGSIQFEFGNDGNQSRISSRSNDQQDGDSRDKGQRAGWGNDREMPRDSMPSRTDKWGTDREMPSDSMPSRTEKWGADRKMPSDSGNWGKNRSMPSDSAFR